MGRWLVMQMGSGYVDVTREKVQMEKDSNGQTGCGAAPQGLFNRSTAWASLLRAHNQGYLPGGQGQAWLGVGVEVWGDGPSLLLKEDSRPSSYKQPETLVLFSSSCT